MKKLLCLVLCLVFCLSLAACGKSDGDDTDPNAGGNSDIVLDDPADDLFVNPLTGETGEDDYTATNRPLAVMINNIKAALPQYGINDADLTYEFVTEGGITRMMCLFSDYRNVEKIGSVRSARPYYIDMAVSHNAVFLHFGGSPHAYDLLDQIDLDTIDGQYMSSTAFVFDKVRNQTTSKEHCWFTTPDKIEAGAAKKGFTMAGESDPAFKFVAADEAAITLSGGTAKTVTWDFSGYGKNMQLIYNTETGEYEKYEYGSPQIDANDGSTFSVTNALILYDEMHYLDTKVHVGFAFDGGSGYYFTKGTYTPITWTKGEFGDQIMYYGPDENELQVNVGQTYVAFVSTDYQDDIEIK